MVPQPAIAYLKKGGIVCVEEVHTEAVGRLLTRDLIQGGWMHTLFIEYSPDLTRGRAMWNMRDKLMPLADSFAQLRGKSIAQIQQAIDQNDYFSELVSGDAAPNIRQLTAEALASGINVVPVDPENQRGPGQVAIEKRNQESAFIIGRYFRQNNLTQNQSKGAVLLMGANHFAPAGNYDMAALLIREQIAPVTSINMINSSVA